MKKENIKLWESVETTDSKFTKETTVSKRTFTSISSYWIFKQATKVFGAFGLGWGVSEEKENKIHLGETSEIILEYEAILWYMLDGKKGEFRISHDIKYYYKTNAGYMKLDIDAKKKVRTDAISKGLSMLGFGGDVFMSMFDDTEYLQSLKNQEKAIEKIKNAEKISEQAVLDSRIKNLLISQLAKVDTYNSNSDKVMFLMSLWAVAEEKERSSIRDEFIKNLKPEVLSIIANSKQKEDLYSLHKNITDIDTSLYDEFKSEFEQKAKEFNPKK